MFFRLRLCVAFAVSIIICTAFGCTPYDTRRYQPWGPAPSPSAQPSAQPATLPSTGVPSGAPSSAPSSARGAFDASVPRATVPAIREPLGRRPQDELPPPSNAGRLFPNITRPNWSSPGTVQQQRTRAVLHDPYADNLMAPEIVGGRPREFSRPTGPIGVNANDGPRRSPWGF